MSLENWILSQVKTVKCPNCGLHYKPSSVSSGIVNCPTCNTPEHIKDFIVEVKKKNGKKKRT